MTTIRTTCPNDGEVDMGPEAIRLFIKRDGEGTYIFHCPQCFDEVEKRADKKIISLLVSAGVNDIYRQDASGNFVDAKGDMVEEEDKLEAIDEADRSPGGELATLDDLIDFHFKLKDDDAIMRELFGGK